ncbi:hypothetical protein [Roseomonas indoligenes]|uniref:Uncharacterized protein n=1 Tax=Roseomonas indoligenes TaxID=2820811 RepID=A0A940SAK5_9PROT|nr:hypothetical protein [Pararoseomonas indoligenes]MBP0496468.1 hypothetical protein [Pararoseomonas indoligenes]
MAMPRYTPTEEQRRVVKTMAAYGIPQDAIAKVVHCSEPTLRRAYRYELDTAVHEANTRVAQCLYQQATTPGIVAASIFWLKARAGWREKQVHEISGPEGKPIEPARIVYAWYPGDPLLEGPMEVKHQ